MFSFRYEGNYNLFSKGLKQGSKYIANHNICAKYMQPVPRSKILQYGLPDELQNIPRYNCLHFLDCLSII